MRDMTTRVELTPRTTRSDHLIEGKPTRSYVSPLSDASNKSSDSNMSSSLIIEESTVVPSKVVNMFNSGMKPRLSPKPFTREKPPETSRTAELISALSADVKPQSNVPFQTSTSISLSGSPKSEENERVGRRIFTSIRQPNTEEDQVNKPDTFSSAALHRKQPNVSWTSMATSESKSTSLVDEPRVTSKPPLMSRKPDLSQQQEKPSVFSIGKNATNPTEQKESLEKAKFKSFQTDAMDSLSVRAQLRPKRRPASMFIDSVNDQTTESKVVDSQRTSTRRPLSEDLTSLFENIGHGNKTEIPSEEFKENRPLKRNSFNRSIIEDQPDTASKAGEFSSPKSASSETKTGTSGSSSRNMFSARGSKATTEVKSMNMPEKSVVPENSTVEKRSVNSVNQASKVLPDYSESSSSTNEVKNADDSGIVPGITKRRISLYLANSDSSVDSVDLPINKEDKNNLSIEKTKGTVSDKDVEFGRPWLTSKSQATDVPKIFSTSPPNVDARSEKIVEERSMVFQDYGVQKEKKDWRTSDISEEKLIRTRRSFKKMDEPLQLDDSKNIFKEGKAYASKNNHYTSKIEDADSKYKKPAQLDNLSKTVKATMFEHNVEWHSPPEVFSANNPTVSESARSEILPHRSEVRNEAENWSKWWSANNVNSVTEFPKESDVADTKSNESKVQVASSAANNDDRQNLKTFYEKRPVEPRYEVIQAVGERVLSESIQMAPEDKAVTLRSRRSFHKKEKELQNLELEGSVFSRSASGLQRSKSEYRKRVTQESTQERSADKYFSRELDFSFRKNSTSAEKRDPFKLADKTNETIQKKSIVDNRVSDDQQNIYKLDYKPKRDNTLDEVSTRRSFEITKPDGKEIKTSLTDYNWHKLKSSSDLAEKRLENEPRNIFKDEQTLIRSNVRDDIQKTPHIEEFNKQAHQRNRFLSDNDSVQIQKENNTESKDDFSTMLNKEVPQIKKDLTVTQPTKELNFGSSERHFKEEHTEEHKLERKKASFQDKNKSGYGSEIAPETFTSDYDNSSKKQNMSTMKDSPRAESKATYFAVTGLDNRKVKKDSILEFQSNSASSRTSDDYIFKHESRLNAAYWGSDDNYKPEEKNIQGGLGTSSASKERTTYRHQNVQEDSVGKTEKPSEKLSEKRSVIDIDALIKRHRQKPGLDDKSTPRRDFHAKQELKISETELDTSQSSPLNLDGSYKSKVVDIDSLMADYSANNQKERISNDETSNISKGERSRSFRESTSKGSSSKWRDPSVKHITTEESYQYETVGSWYSSREATSIKGEPKLNKTTANVGHITDKKYPDKGKEDQHSQALSGMSPALVTLDSLLESSKRTTDNFKTRSKQYPESRTLTADRFSSQNLVKPAVTEISVDRDSEEISEAVKLQHRTFMQTTKTSVLSEEVQTTRKSVSSDERQPPSEVRRPAKASDLISLMLENKEKRMEQHRSRRSLPVEPPLEGLRYKYQQEWYSSESKDYSVKEVSRHRTKPPQEQEIVTDLPRRKSLNRQREQNLKSEQDHVKQCFSRSSTGNKDTDSLVQDPEQKYGTWSQDKPTEDSCVTESPSYDNGSRKQHSHSRLSSLSHTETDQHDSITEARDVSLDRCSMDSTDGTESTPSFNEAKGSDFPSMDQTSVLDSTALKNRVQLSRKSQRRAPSQVQRRSRLLQPSSQLAVIEDTDNPWMYTDSTEAKPEKKDVDEEEEKPQRSSVHSPRMPVFPGMDHSTLMAQLRKRQDAESSSESSPQSKSPKSPLPHGTVGVKLLPTPGDKPDKGAGESPQWLKELKSKKRLSQYENPS